MDMIGINTPTAVQAVKDQQCGKDIAEFSLNAGQKGFIEEEIGAQDEVKSRHGDPENKHGRAEDAAVAEAILCRHSKANTSHR